MYVRPMATTFAGYLRVGDEEEEVVVVEGSVCGLCGGGEISLWANFYRPIGSVSAIS
jgi:hypothetical protein